MGSCIPAFHLDLKIWGFRIESQISLPEAEAGATEMLDVREMHQGDFSPHKTHFTIYNPDLLTVDWIILPAFWISCDRASGNQASV